MLESNQGLATISGCKNLEWLDLSQTAATDEGFSEVAGATKLTQLPPLERRFTAGPAVCFHVTNTGKPSGSEPWPWR